MRREASIEICAASSIRRLISVTDAESSTVAAATVSTSEVARTAAVTSSRALWLAASAASLTARASCFTSSAECASEPARSDAVSRNRSAARERASAAAAAVIWSWTSIRVPQAREAAPERSRANPQVLRNQWNEPSRRRERKQTS